jgi:UDP-N-acetylglucosamine 1-carboxyvinyltransferase
VIELEGGEVNNLIASYDIVRKMRASVLVLGPLLSRFGEAKVSLPGGCAIGTRPIDLHLEALKAMGAEVTLEDGYVHAKAPKGHLHGAEVTFSKVSVGATENAIMAATLADGETILHNAAQEPEITDLIECLQKMGANIEGKGTSTIYVRGVKELHSANHRVIADRIEAGTYAVAALATGGDIHLTDIDPSILESTLALLKNVGAGYEEGEHGFRIWKKGGDFNPMDIVTEPHPGFPTDMQAQVMVLLCLAQGKSNVTEDIFENRFMHVAELLRMGAKLDTRGNTVTVTGIDTFKGAEVMATDLRASVCLVIAALAGQGETIINRVYHIDRGYERIEEKIRSCGGYIERIRA